MGVRVEDIKLDHRVIGAKHVFTSPDVPELHISHADEATAYQSIQPALDAMEQVKQRLEARQIVRSPMRGKAVAQVLYLAADIYAYLQEAGCMYEGDRQPTGQVWIGPGCQVFFLPDPDEIDGQRWLDADVLRDNLTNRWAGFSIPDTIERYPHPI